MGDAIDERLQLDPQVDVDALNLTPAGNMIARAMQEHGMVFADSCGVGCNRAYAESFDDKPGQSWGDTFGDLSAIPLDKLRVLEPILPTQGPTPSSSATP
jgi:hypothetical protein